MNRKRTRNTRDLGISGGAGKGDASRTIFNAAWRARYDLIVWGDCIGCNGTGRVLRLDAPLPCFWCSGTGKDTRGFERDGHKLVKRYK